MPDTQRAIAELQRLIDGIPVAMVTTIAADDVLRCRPMLVERLQPDATLVFLTHLSSQKTDEVRRDPRVNIAFQSDKGDRYVSVSGTARVTHDVERMRQLWHPTYRAWFPGGVDEPDSAIFTVRIDRVEYWDVPSSRLVRLWGVVKALATGEVAESGEYRRIEFGEGSDQGQTGVRPGSDRGQTGVRPGSDRGLRASECASNRLPCDER